MPEEIAISRGNLLTTLASLKTQWRVSLQLKPTSYLDIHTFSVHLTIGGDKEEYGDRTPAIKFNPGKGMLIDSAVNGDKKYGTMTDLPLVNTWTAILVSQEFINDKIIYSIKVEDKEVFSVENTDHREFTDVKVYASDPWYTAQPGYIKDLTIEMK